MKQVFFLLLLSSTCFAATAQTWEEWSQQKQTQLKYLLQQIAALKVYAASAQKGYGIARDGLNLIQDIKNGDYHLHFDYINALKMVNPNIKAYARIASLMALQVKMVKGYHNTLHQFKQSNSLHKDKLNYYQQVCEILLQQCTGNINLLLQLTADNQFEMSDDERLRRIGGLYEDLQNQAAFLQRFNNDMKTLGMQRLKEKEDVKTMQLLYGVK